MKPTHLSVTSKEEQLYRLTFFIVAAAAMLLPVPAPGQQEPATKEEVEEVRAVLEGLNESATEYRNYVDALRKIKVTGYLQPQFRFSKVDNVSWDIGTFSGGRFPQYSKNLFNLRRARVKFNYDNILTQFVLQIDVVQSGVAIKDAYLSLTEPWLQSFGFTAGVFDRPFGYEISFSSSSRESPERSRVYQTLMPGERELGAKLSFAPQLGSLSFLKAEVGVVNGAGPTNAEFDNFKDFIGRVGAQFPFEDAGTAVDVGLSGYFGMVRSGSSEIFRMGTQPSGDPGYLRERDTANQGKGFDRRYLGVDAQLYYDVPVLGGLIVRGEYLFGKQPGLASTSVSVPTIPTVGTPLYLRDFSGWYLYVVQNLGSKNQVLVKYDVYDPNTEVTAGEMKTGSGFSVADLRYSTLGLGAIHHWDDNIKFVLYYEIVRNETVTKENVPSGPLAVYATDVRDNVVTFRIQYKF